MTLELDLINLIDRLVSEYLFGQEGPIIKSLVSSFESRFSARVEAHDFPALDQYELALAIEPLGHM